jgi:hypothetical protein
MDWLSWIWEKPMFKKLVKDSEIKELKVCNDWEWRIWFIYNATGRLSDTYTVVKRIKHSNTSISQPSSPVSLRTHSPSGSESNLLNGEKSSSDGQRGGHLLGLFVPPSDTDAQDSGRRYVKSYLLLNHCDLLNLTATALLLNKRVFLRN